MKRLLLIPLALLLLGQTQVQTVPGDGGPINFDRGGNAKLSIRLLNNAGTAPTPSACGGTGLTLTGNDFAGTVTVGSTPTTSCTITFAVAYAVAPVCNLTWPSGNLAAMSWTTSATAITVTQTSTASNVINYLCFSRQ